MSVYEKLSVINVNDKKSKKNNLDYLSWAFAWAEVKKVYPEAKLVCGSQSRNLVLVRFQLS